MKMYQIQKFQLIKTSTIQLTKLMKIIWSYQEIMYYIQLVILMKVVLDWFVELDLQQKKVLQ